jgi:predicted methyltransferase
MKYINVKRLSIFLCFFCLNLYSYSLQDAIESDLRSSVNQERDIFRHPYETLSFFGISSDMTLVELSPGSGWYTEILAPYIGAGSGKFIAAAHDASKGSYQKRSRERYETKLSTNGAFDKVSIVTLGEVLAEKGSVDAVLTFRNLHSWLGPNMGSIFSQSFDALKSGGIFGIVTHRANPGTSVDEMKKSGYVTQELAIEEAKKVGFILVKTSEINANSKDTKNYEKGVWTLPPVLRLKEEGRAKYIEIGESDRMTLLFKKP